MEKLQEPRNESDCRKKAKSKEKKEAKQRGETLFSHLFYTLSDNGQFVKHSKRGLQGGWKSHQKVEFLHYIASVASYKMSKNFT